MSLLRVEKYTSSALFITLSKDPDPVMGIPEIASFTLSGNCFRHIPDTAVSQQQDCSGGCCVHMISVNLLHKAEGVVVMVSPEANS